MLGQQPWADPVCLANADIPSLSRAAGLDFNDSVHVKSLNLPANCTPVDKTTTVATIARRLAALKPPPPKLAGRRRCGRRAGEGQEVSFLKTCALPLPLAKIFAGGVFMRWAPRNAAAGLIGNPGKAYAGNRHNIGFMALDAIARELNAPPFRKKFQGEATEAKIGSERVLLLKPDTFMNESGPVGGRSREIPQDPGLRCRRLPRRARSGAGKNADQARRRRRRP